MRKLGLFKVDHKKIALMILNSVSVRANAPFECLSGSFMPVFLLKLYFGSRLPSIHPITEKYVDLTKILCEKENIFEFMYCFCNSFFPAFSSFFFS